MGIFKIE